MPEISRPAPTLDRAVIERASLWMARLWSGEASEADRAACERWRAAHPHHELAWRRLQGMEDKLSAVPSDIARLALRQTPDRAMRRRLLGLAAAGAPLALMAYLARETPWWRSAIADYRTATGEIRSIQLSDGTRVVMDTGAALNVRFEADTRHIELLAGKILVRTGSPDGLYRPFFVHSRHGLVQALGTVFQVQQDEAYTRVAVLEHAVEIRPALGGQALRAEAGQRVRFSARLAEPIVDASAANTSNTSNDGSAWSRGQLLADDMPIADLIAELARYRQGILRCDPAVATLRVTGVFPLLDTDRALAILAAGLPVQAVYRSPYWVTVTKR